MAKKYKKRPITIEAMQLTKDNVVDVLSFCNSTGNIVASNEDDMGISILTFKGTILATTGDYIIKGLKGEFYPCKADIFEQTYEEVDG